MRKATRIVNGNKIRYAIDNLNNIISEISFLFLNDINAIILITIGAIRTRKTEPIDAIPDHFHNRVVSKTVNNPPKQPKTMSSLMVNNSKLTLGLYL